MKKKLLSILLSLAMVLTMIPFATMTAFATDKSINSISVTVSELSVEEIQTLGTGTASNMVVTATAPIN